MMKTLAYYRKLNYKMVISYDVEEKAFFVEFPELPGCMADGETVEKAIKTARKVKDVWLETVFDAGWKIPEPSVYEEPSGRLTLRLEKFIHKMLIERAEQEAVSINKLISTFIVQGLERITAKDSFEQINTELKKQTTFLTNLTKVSQPFPRETGTWEPPVWDSIKNIKQMEPPERSEDIN